MFTVKSLNVIKKVVYHNGIDVQNNCIKNVKTPEENSDAANKKYVDRKFKTLLIFIIFLSIVVITNISS